MAIAVQPNISVFARVWIWLVGRDWRSLFARLPLPMLALAASYGVFRFSSFFVPWYVALTTALAFELTYIGLSATRNLSESARRRASAISIGAVAVSILYNSLAGLFDRNPTWLQHLAWPWELALALLHGAPLALVAYLVADLLLHSDTGAASLEHISAWRLAVRAAYIRQLETLSERLTHERDAAHTTASDTQATIKTLHAHIDALTSERTDLHTVVQRLTSERDAALGQLATVTTTPVIDLPSIVTALHAHGWQLPHLAAAMVDRCGSVQAAADALGTSRQTMTSWLQKA